MPTLTTRAIKCTLVLDPLEVVAIGVPQVPRVVLHVQLADDSRSFTVDVAAKSVRKAQAMIAEHGPDRVAALIQGKLTEGNVVAEAGLVVVPKAPKPAQVAATARLIVEGPAA